MTSISQLIAERIQGLFRSLQFRYSLPVYSYSDFHFKIALNIKYYCLHFNTDYVHECRYLALKNNSYYAQNVFHIYEIFAVFHEI